MSSLRVLIHVTGRPVRNAAAATTNCSAYSPALPPNPPPTWGVTTRTSALSTFNARARPICSTWGIWVEP